MKLLKMINRKLNIFAYPFLPSRAVSVTNGYSPLTVWKSFLHCFGGFIIIAIFAVTVVQYHRTTLNFDTAQNQKSDFSKYERGKSLSQRKLPSNVQLPTTRRGIHSTPNSPAKEQGGFLDRIHSVACCINKGYSNLMNPKVGMNYREGMSNLQIL